MVGHLTKFVDWLKISGTFHQFLEYYPVANSEQLVRSRPNSSHHLPTEKIQ